MITICFLTAHRSKSIPSSLFKEEIEGQIDRYDGPANPKNHYFVLRPGCFFMHITCWQPDIKEDFDKSSDGIWLVYSWTKEPGLKGGRQYTDGGAIITLLTPATLRIRPLVGT